VAPRRRSSVLFRIRSRLIHDSWTVVVCLNDLMTTTAIESRHGALSPAELEAVDERLHHRAYTREFGDDPADVREWAWPAPHA
jgi:hypothetical protein